MIWTFLIVWISASVAFIVGWCCGIRVTEQKLRPWKIFIVRDVERLEADGDGLTAEDVFPEHLKN